MSEWQSIGDVIGVVVDKIAAEKMDMARGLRANGLSYGKIVAATGLSMYVLKCEFEPGYRERVAATVKRGKAARRQGRTAKGKAQHEHIRRVIPQPIYTLPIPNDVLADRDRRQAMQPRSLTAALMGDPPSPDWHKRA